MDKKISKNFLLIALMAFSLLFSGCTDVGTSSDAATSEETQEIHSTAETDAIESNQPDTEDLSSESDIVFEGVLGETLFGTESYSILGDGFYIFNDWTYISLSDGLVRNSYDNPEFFNEYGTYEDFPTLANDYFVMNVGDKLGDLTLEQAYTIYQYIPDIYTKLTVLSADFSGELTLSGYMYIGGGNDGYIDEGTIVFLVDDGEWSGLPYLHNDIENGGCIFNDLSWYAHAATLLLYTGDSNFNLPEPGSITHVTATIANPSLFKDFWGALGYHSNTAELIDFELD